MKTTLYLVRHGESIGNLQHRFLGHTNLDLSPRGYLQANATFEYMKGFQIDAVYSSSLMRAVNTVLPHAKHRGLEVIPMDALREVYIGIWEGLSTDEILHRWPYTFTEIWVKQFAICTPPGGEYLQDAATRVLSALEEIAKKHEGQAVLVGGHGGIFRVVCARILGIAPERVDGEFFFPTNASVTTLSYEDGKFTLEQYSYDEHLSGIGITNI